MDRSKRRRTTSRKTYSRPVSKNKRRKQRIIKIRGRRYKLVRKTKRGAVVKKARTLATPFSTYQPIINTVPTTPCTKNRERIRRDFFAFMHSNPPGAGRGNKKHNNRFTPKEC